MGGSGGVAKYRTRRMDATYGGFNRQSLELDFYAVPE
jgi:hypothetical protein